MKGKNYRANIALAFRFKPEERDRLKELARRWNTTQIGVLRRLLASAEKLKKLEKLGETS